MPRRDALLLCLFFLEGTGSIPTPSVAVIPLGVVGVSPAEIEPSDFRRTFGSLAGSPKLLHLQQLQRLLPFGKTPAVLVFTKTPAALRTALLPTSVIALVDPLNGPQIGS